MIVVDASALLEVLLVTPRGVPVAHRLRAATSLHAPHLLDLEIAQVLRRLVHQGQLPWERGEQALADLADLDLERWEHHPLIPRVWELRANLTAYDAVYVALAEGIGAPLLTCDGRTARAPGVRARIDLVR